MTNTTPTSINLEPLQYNLLKLYRQHRDEIDTLSDPTTLFILDFTSHYGNVQLDELAGDLGLSPTALRKKISPLLRGQMLVENGEAVSVTTLGKQLLDYIDFLPPLAVSSDLSSLPRQVPSTPPQPQFGTTASTPDWLWGAITFLGIALVVLLIVLIVELGIASTILTSPLMR